MPQKPISFAILWRESYTAGSTPLGNLPSFCNTSFSKRHQFAFNKLPYRLLNYFLFFSERKIQGDLLLVQS